MGDAAKGSSPLLSLGAEDVDLVDVSHFIGGLAAGSRLRRDSHLLKGSRARAQMAPVLLFFSLPWLLLFVSSHSFQRYSLEVLTLLTLPLGAAKACFGTVQGLASGVVLDHDGVVNFD